MSACRRLPPPSQRRLLCRHMPRLPASPSTAPQATSLPLFSQVKLVLQQNRFFVESPHPEILRKLLADPVVKDAARLDKPGGADGGWPPLLLLSDCCLTWSLASLAVPCVQLDALHVTLRLMRRRTSAGPPAPLPGPLQAPAAASSQVGAARRDRALADLAAIEEIDLAAGESCGSLWIRTLLIA